MNTISQAEKMDVLLVLALAFEKNLTEPGKTLPNQTVVQIVEKSFGAMNQADFSALKSRAGYLDSLPDKKRELWRGACLEKLLRRGKAIRLDENINPVNIVNVLSREPKSLQKLILRNLPANLSQRIASYLEIDFGTENGNGKQPLEEIVALVRREFLSHFVAFEDIYEPNQLDKFSVAELTKFIQHLALREVALACRGIGSKETLAAFLNRFAEESAREIALYITELEKIKPFWVAQADELVRKTWGIDLKPERVLEKISFKLLAIAFLERDETARTYTAQKLSTKDSQRWQRVFQISEKEFSNIGEEEKTRLRKRRKMVEKLASKFIQTGRL